MEMKNVKEIIIPNPDYELLEYIDLPSGCRISLNENGNANTAYYIDANWNLNNDTISNAEYPFGSIYISGSNYYRYHLATNSNINMQACSGNSTYTNLFSATTSARHVIELNYHTYNDKKAYCDDVEKGTFSPTSGTNTGYLRIGGRLVNNGGTLSYNTYSGTIRLYEMKSKTSANDLSIFYPVKRKSDNKIGLFKVYNKGESVRFCVTETEVEPVAGPLSSQNIDIPVKKITNSNGDIIWGSQSAFPYRRLEYIRFSGSEYLKTGFVPNYNKSIKFKLKVWQDWSGGDGNNCLFGAYCSTLSSNDSRRLYWVWARHLSPKSYRIVIGNTWTSTDLTLMSDPAWFGVGFPNNSAFKNAAFGIRNVAWDTALYYKNQTNSTSFTGWSAPFALSGQGNTDGTGVDASRYSCIDVYEGYQHNVASPWGITPDANSPVRHWIPVQRKSNNVCGLYDVLNNTFYPMVGTNITTAAAGPVVDEYWNLQA